MAEYICFEATTSDESDGGEMLTEAADIEMIDDTEQENNDASFFRFCNQTSGPDKILEEIAAQQASELHNLEASNYLQVGEEDQELEIDESASSKINIEKFEEVLKNPIKEQTKVNSFISALFYAPTSDYLYPENDIMFSVSYSIVIAWHPKLNLPRQFVVRGFNHSLEELTDVSYLTIEQLSLRKQTTTEQLRDAAITVSQRKNKNAINILFNIELKFIYDILMKWFKFKIKSSNIAIPQTERIKYERLNPLTDDTKCKICNFPMQKQIRGLEYEGNEQSYLDFLIKKNMPLYEISLTKKN